MNDFKKIGILLYKIIKISSLIAITIYTTIQICEKFMTPKINFIEEYLFIAPSNLLHTIKINNIEPKDKQLATEFIKQLTKQHPSFDIILNNVIINAFNQESYFRIQSYFCNSLKLNGKERDLCIESNESYLFPYIATYSLTNINNFTLENIEIIFAQTDNDTMPIYSYDNFINRGFIKGEYLYSTNAVDKIIPLVKVPRRIKIKIDNLKPGRTILIPIYVWNRFIYNDEYDGFIYPYPMLYPLRVLVKGKVVINTPKIMSLTPTLRLGEIEARG